MAVKAKAKRKNKKLNKKTLIKAANQVYKDMPELRKVAIKIIEKYYSK